MTSEIDVCNEALGLLGDDAISTLTDDNDRARLCNRFYYSARDEVMASHNWRCLAKWEQLALLTTTPAYGYTYYFQIPTDCAKIIQTDLDDDNIEWRREGNMIATDETTVYLFYVERVADPSRWSPMMKKAVTIALAEKICTGVGKGDRKDKLKEEYEFTLAMAQFHDATEATPEKIENTELLEVR